MWSSALLPRSPHAGEDGRDPGMELTAAPLVGGRRHCSPQAAVVTHPQGMISRIGLMWRCSQVLALLVMSLPVGSVAAQIEAPMRSAGAVLTADAARSLVDAARTAARLRAESRLQFRRGLLPLPDYLEHLAGAFAAESSWEDATAAAETDGKRRPSRALQARIAALQEAADWLQQFQQPAAANWEADLALARLTLVRARGAAAAQAGNAAVGAQLSQEETALALAHYQRRWFDARILGHASSPALVHAAAFLNIAPEQRQRLLTGAVATTARWNRAGAEIGRQDQLLAAQFDLALFQLPPAGSQATVNERTLAEADRLASALFAARLDYYRRGTASLADLSRSWQLHRHLHLQAESVGAAIPTDWRRARSRDLATLGQLADAVVDLRGRNASDVTFVRLLTQIDAAEAAP